jgi:hypothetical protein
VSIRVHSWFKKSAFADAVEVFEGTDEDLAIGKGGGGVGAFSEGIGVEDFELVGIGVEDVGCAFLVGDVEESVDID